jgi:UDP-N-acetyl-D-mannosaminuronic acid dehydrogenase
VKKAQGGVSLEGELMKAIRNKTARIVVIGLGYVGLPVACMFARAGFQVVGIRRNSEKVAQINQGICPIEGKEAGLPELLAEVIREGRLKATTDYAECRRAQIALIAVETPVNKTTKEPGYEALQATLHALGQNLQPGTLVIIESTIAPGTMERVVKPILEEASGLKVNEDFYLANCPERVMPGKLLANIENCSRVVGGMSPETAQAAVELYRYIVKADLDPTDCLTAELVKTVENTYRDVQIAFANEVALLSESVGADVWEVRQLVNKSPQRDMHLPGPGVGGHCIPKDPWLLVYGAGDGFEARLIPTARAVNDSMPLHMVELVEGALHEAGKEVQGARIAILGYAYKENTDDARNSPAIPLIKRLEELGAEIAVHDPYVRDYNDELEKVVTGSDCVVVMAAHDQYRELDLENLKTWLRMPALVDGRNVFSMRKAQETGFIYKGVGNV